MINIIVFIGALFSNRTFIKYFNTYLIKTILWKQFFNQIAKCRLLINIIYIFIVPTTILDLDILSQVLVTPDSYLLNYCEQLLFFLKNFNHFNFQIKYGSNKCN